MVIKRLLERAKLQQYEIHDDEGIMAAPDVAMLCAVALLAFAFWCRARAILGFGIWLASKAKDTEFGDDLFLAIVSAYNGG